MDKQQVIRKIGNKICEYRELKGLSQLDLSAIVNIEKSNLSRLENGRTNPTIATLVDICNALSIDIKLLFD